MNSFGRLFRVTIFGESHGELVGINIDGCPPGIKIAPDDFLTDIERRKGGKELTTKRVEEDIPEIVSGLFNNLSTGAPLTILVRNKNINSKDYSRVKEIPRPGHSDFVAEKKFHGFQDYRGGGHFSGRLTLPLVLAGVIAKKILYDIIFETEILEIGGEHELQKGMDKAKLQNDSIGGIVECRVKNLPIGLGEPFFDSVESLISHLAFSIPAIKGIEFGSGFASVKMFGTENNDVMIDKTGKTKTNNSGGISGGITNGNDLVFRVAVKPTSSTPKEQEMYNLATEKVENFGIKGRHDLCIALRIPVILEAISAIVLTDLIMVSNAHNEIVKNL